MKRLILLTAGLFCTAALSQSPAPANPDQGNASNDDQAPVEIGAVLERMSFMVDRLRAIAAQVGNDVEAQKASQAQIEREIRAIALAEQDLVAQQQMAEYTRLIYMVTAAGVFVSVFGIYGLFRNLTLTNLIVNQQRAWLVVKTADAKLVDASFVKPDHVAVILQLKNCGGSPAINVNVDTGYYVAKQYNPDRFFEYIPTQNKGAVIGGNGEWRSLPVYIEGGDIDLVRPGSDQQTIFFKINIAYGITTGKGTKTSSAWYALKIVRDDPEALLKGEQETLELAITDITDTVKYS